MLCEIDSEVSLLTVRMHLRSSAKEIGLDLASETKFITAASELARNILAYARQGSMTVERVELNGRRGVQARFEDGGPGIDDIDLAMKDSYTSRHGLGMGLPGAKRLSDDFSIQSTPGVGTVVTITKWAR